jgi:hypothetical protein
MALPTAITPPDDTCGWDPGRGSRRALYHHGEHVEDGLSGCETVFACLDYDSNGNHFDVGTDMDFANVGSE